MWDILEALLFPVLATLWGLQWPLPDEVFTIIFLVLLLWEIHWGHLKWLTMEEISDNERRPDPQPEDAPEKVLRMLEICDQILQEILHLLRRHNPDTSSEESDCTVCRRRSEIARGRSTEDGTFRSTDSPPLTGKERATRPQTSLRGCRGSESHPLRVSGLEPRSHPPRASGPGSRSHPPRASGPESWIHPPRAGGPDSRSPPPWACGPGSKSHPPWASGPESWSHPPRPAFRSQEVTLPGPAVRGQEVTLSGRTVQSHGVTLPRPAVCGPEVTLPGPAFRTQEVTLPRRAMRGQEVTVPGRVVRGQEVTLPRRVVRGQDLTFSKGLNWLR
ncbi:basic salivary proline-rich protein 3-like [Ornithorhynchus anatinus]|uniref:basic salivary proline-rich protein 3-like n=1 Tax=Ornithorhynchus anatinus TaxID=9258 RepID=UPI0010A8C123|nr:basic salivary proline-rich protein 3-like [Ornithorhynchus anatinus]